MAPSLTGVTPTISAPARTYHVVTAVWGAEFIELFLDVCVPNQLSQGNLPALPQGRVTVFSPGVRIMRRLPPVRSSTTYAAYCRSTLLKST